MVDRTTPATTDHDRRLVAEATGHLDAVPVLTEPFAEWVLAGDFPAGRPSWEGAGAQVVADADPYARRKLLLLNGAHSLLTYAGALLALGGGTALAAARAALEPPGPPATPVPVRPELAAAFEGLRRELPRRLGPLAHLPAQGDTP